ncbi:MAG: hypothetical protein OHK0039_42090 [Bacteroidia bacterium]
MNLRRLIVSLSLLMILAHLPGQEVTGDTLAAPATDSLYTAADTSVVLADSLPPPDPRLLPLDTLISLALRHSPMLHAQDALITGKELAIAQQRLLWTDMVSGLGGASYGNGQILNSSSDGANIDYNLVTRSDLFYSVGVNLRLSPYKLLTQGKQRQQLEADLARSHADRRVLEQRIAEAVIDRYQDLMLAQKLRQIRAANLENHRINAAMAQRYFEAGDLAFSEYGMTLEFASKAEADVESALNDELRAYLLLKTLVGTEIER